MHYKADEVIDLCEPFEEGKGSAFELTPPKYECIFPNTSVDYLKVDRISFCAHASGTHTECVAHVFKEKQNMDLTSCGIFDYWKIFRVCVVLNVAVTQVKHVQTKNETYDGKQIITEYEKDEYLIDSQQILKAIRETTTLVLENDLLIEAIFLNVNEPKEKPFISDNAMDLLLKTYANVKALLINTQSVDRERCSSLMPAHRAFFNHTKDLGSLKLLLISFN